MLTVHLKPNRVVFTEVMVFRRAKCFEGESATEFATRLRGLAKYCEFKDVDTEILQQFIVGIDRPEVERIWSHHRCVVRGLHATTEKKDDLINRRETTARKAGTVQSPR